MRFSKFLALALALWAAPAAAQIPQTGAGSSLVSWVLPGSDIDMDFANSRYYGCASLTACVTVTRASSGLAQDLAGVWSSFSNNVARITNQGFLIEEARTNKCTNYNANPPALVTPAVAATFNAAVTNMTAGGDAAALFGVVDDTAAITAAGLQNVTNGRVYKIDNTAGVTTASITVNGTTGNANPHVMSAFIRGGTGSLRDNSAGGTQAFGASSSYVRRTYSYTPANGLGVWGIRVDAGQIVYFTVEVLEEGPFVTSPIVTAGASATRAADVPQLIGPALTAALAAKSAFFQTSGVGGLTAGAYNVLLYYSAGQRVRFIDNIHINQFSVAGSVSGTLGSGSWAGTVKTAFNFDAASVTLKANAGALGTGVYDGTVGVGGTPYVGNTSDGTRALNGYMQRFALSNIKGVFDGATAP